MWHANEGHAAFLHLERLREFFQQGISYDDAVDYIRHTSLFTTHTPVPAGHDVFPDVPRSHGAAADEAEAFFDLATRDIEGGDEDHRLTSV